MTREFNVGRFFWNHFDESYGEILIPKKADAQDVGGFTLEEAGIIAKQLAEKYSSFDRKEFDLERINIENKDFYIYFGLGLVSVPLDKEKRNPIRTLDRALIYQNG